MLVNAKNTPPPKKKMSLMMWSLTPQRLKSTCRLPWQRHPLANTKPRPGRLCSTDARRSNVYVAIGTNLGDRALNVLTALRALKKDVGEIKKTSFLYETSPQYVEDQPLFLNAACHIESTLDPQELLHRLKDIEENMGRVETVRNGPRVIDLDILFFEDQIINCVTSKGLPLTVPHPAIAEREFVLRPLCDLAPRLAHPAPPPAAAAAAAAVAGDGPPTAAALLRAFLDAKPKGADLARRIMPLNKGRQLTFDKGTLLMGVVNCTPDSFSDGGVVGPSGGPAAARTDWVQGAVAAALRMAEAGADIVDVGGESTRPGADPVPVEEEIARVVPVVAGLRAAGGRGAEVAISVDTRSRLVAAAAHAAGADIINDVSGGYHDPSILSYASIMGLPMIMMHMKGDPQTMNSLAKYDDVISEVSEYLLERVCYAESLGIPRWNQMLDPGIGFAKDFDHNMRIMADLDKLIDQCENVPVLLGPSRKRFLGTLTGAEPRDRDFATAAAVCAGIQRGAAVVRVHEVAGMKQVVTVFDAISNYGKEV